MKAVDSAAVAARLGDRPPFEGVPGKLSPEDPVRRRSTRWRIGPTEVDRHVGRRVRMQRLQVGLTQDRLARLIGVSCHQQHKYERGISRLSAGRLYAIARVLDVGVEELFFGLESPPSLGHDQLPLDFSHAFVGIRDKRYQEAVCLLARMLADEG